MGKDLGHSEEYFGDYRDDWWNKDFIKLMGQRWSLQGVQKVLDVGCGVGHWSRVLFSVLPETSHVTGMDNDPKWVTESEEQMNSLGYGERFKSVKGSADQIPFEGKTFDLISCQTVLIHVPDISKVLSEFHRVLKPGGKIVLVEPNNIASYLVKSSLSEDQDIEELLEDIRFAMMCEKGKKELGMGDSSAGDLIPGLAAAAGFKGIQVYLSDRASPLFPPYSDPKQKRLVGQYEKTSGGDFGEHAQQELQKQFFAGGGNEEAFKKYLDRDDGFLKAIRSMQYHSGGGSIMYLISGYKA